MTWPATNVMMLGKLRNNQRINDPQYPPRPTIDYLPINTTPLAGQHVIKQIVMNGVKGVAGGLRGVHGLGETIHEAAADIQADGGTQQAYPESASNGYSYAAMPTWYKVGLPVLVLASGAASLYHGYKRNNSLGWGLAWWLMGSAFPVITPTVALAQGYSKRKGR